MSEVLTSRDLETCKELVQRIVASSYLSKSTRLTDMFLYLCTKVLDEGAQDIHELELGHYVFGRSTRYDTTADNIVRVHASMLRKRLGEYFAAEGREEPFIVEIPRGNYAPLFRKRDMPDHGSRNIEAEAPHLTVTVIESAIMEGAPHAPMGSPDSPRDLKTTADAVRSTRWIPWTRTVSSGLAVAFALLSLILFIRLQQATSLAKSASPAANGVVRQFWSQIFRKDQSAVVVLDDASLKFYQEATGHPIALAEYFDRSYLQSTGTGEGSSKLDPGLIQAFVLRRQSNFADAAIIWNLAGIANTLRSNGRVQFARDLSFRQAKSSNLILLGKAESDPWIQLFESNLSLQWKFDPEAKASYPIDTATPAEQNRFRASAENSKNREGYATISFLPNLSGTGNVLIVSGTGGATIDAAMDWLLDESSMRSLQSRLPRAGSHDFPYFETLLRVDKGTSVPRNVSIAICRSLKVAGGDAPKSVAAR